MSEIHEDIEELLAGYALRALSDADAEAAERAIAEHVPRCLRCRAALADFQAAAGELGLAPAPSSPPDLVLARLHRDLDATPVRRRGRFGTWAAATAAVLAVGLAVWNAQLTQRVGRAEARQSTMADALFTMFGPSSETVSLAEETADPTRIYVAYLPGSDHMFLLGTGVPMPQEGHVYWVWVARGGEWFPVAEFLPSDGQVVIEMPADPDVVDEILIAEEVEGQAGPRPGQVRWAGPLK